MSIHLTNSPNPQLNPTPLTPNELPNYPLLTSIPLYPQIKHHKNTDVNDDVEDLMMIGKIIALRFKET